MNNDDYSEILSEVRSYMREIGLDALDSEIVLSLEDFDMESSRSNRKFEPYQYLINYLNAFQKRINIGTEKQYEDMLARFQKNIKRDPDSPLDGIGLVLSQEETSLYKINDNENQFFDMKPNSQRSKMIMETVKELGKFLEQLQISLNQKPDDPGIDSDEGMISRADAIRDIKRILTKYVSNVVSTTYGALVPTALADGKFYEAFVLSKVIEKLHDEEGYTVKLVGGSIIKLRGKGGKLDRNYPYFELSKGGIVEAELWTDVYFLSLSYSKSGRPTPNKGDYHELDIVISEPGLSEGECIPHDKILLGVECKHTHYQKHFLREILGVRRELSLRKGRHSTHFTNWPSTHVPADPPSCLMVYCSDRNVREYESPEDFFGINFEHAPIDPTT